MGGRRPTASRSRWMLVEAQTLSERLCSHTATPGSCSIHGPQRLFVPTAPYPSASPPEETDRAAVVQN